jgi:hypothetical protein
METRTSGTSLRNRQREAKPRRDADETHDAGVQRGGDAARAAGRGRAWQEARCLHARLKKERRRGRGSRGARLEAAGARTRGPAEDGRVGSQDAPGRGASQRCDVLGGASGALVRTRAKRRTMAALALIGRLRLVFLDE